MDKKENDELRLLKEKQQKKIDSYIEKQQFRSNMLAEFKQDELDLSIASEISNRKKEKGYLPIELVLLTLPYKDPKVVEWKRERERLKIEK